MVLLLIIIILIFIVEINFELGKNKKYIQWYFKVVAVLSWCTAVLIILILWRLFFKGKNTLSSDFISGVI